MSKSLADLEEELRVAAFNKETSELDQLKLLAAVCCLRGDFRAVNQHFFQHCSITGDFSSITKED